MVEVVGVPDLANGAVVIVFVGSGECLSDGNSYDLVVLFLCVFDLFLEIHLHLLVSDGKVLEFGAQNKGTGVVLSIPVEFGDGFLGWQGPPLNFWAE